MQSSPPLPSAITFLVMQNQEEEEKNTVTFTTTRTQLEGRELVYKNKCSYLKKKTLFD